MRLSAIRSVFGSSPIQVSVGLLLLLTPAWAQGDACGPSPEIRAQLNRIKVVVTGASDFDRGLAPLARTPPAASRVISGSTSAIRMQSSNMESKVT